MRVRKTIYFTEDALDYLEKIMDFYTEEVKTMSGAVRFALKTCYEDWVALSLEAPSEEELFGTFDVKDWIDYEE